MGPIDQKYHWGRAAIQVAFTIFVLTETWLVPIEGYLIDKFGPRAMISASGVLVAIAWVINSVADSFLCFTSAQRSAVLARAWFTAVRWATRSSGSPTDAALLQV